MGLPMSKKSRILIVDDDAELLRSCTKILKNNGYVEVVAISDSTKAVSEIEAEEYDLIISDLSMPEVTGFDLLRKARISAPETPFVIFSAYGNAERVVRAMREGVFDFIEKPFRADRFRVVVEKALHHRSLHKEASILKDQLHEQLSFDNIIGKSQAMQRAFDLISRVVDGDSNITIIAESGTGKELVARSIHAHGMRKSKAFVPVNCGAFPEHLFESELFGYEKGVHGRLP